MHKYLSLVNPGRSESAPARSRATGHAAVDHEFRTRHVAGGVGGEEQHAVGDVLCLASSAQRHPGFCHLIGIDRHVAASGLRYLYPNRGIDDAGVDRIDPDTSPSAAHSIATALANRRTPPFVAQ